MEQLLELQVVGNEEKPVKDLCKKRRGGTCGFGLG